MRIVVVRAASAAASVQPFERVVLGRGRRGEVVHQPDRVEPGRFGRERALEDGGEAHPQLRQEQPEPGHAGHAPVTLRRFTCAGS